MSITSFPFFVLVACTVFVYYSLPLKYRWCALLPANLFFIARSDSLPAGIGMAVMIFVTYGGALLITAYRETKPKSARAVLTASVLFLAGTLIILKDLNFFINTWNLLAGFIHIPVRLSRIFLPAPLGISYFALSWIGYLLDVYWGVAEAEKNIFKFTAFCGFFPLLTSGPIVKYKEDYKHIITGHRFHYQTVCFGLQRVVWGLMKKLVLSARLAVYVNAIYDNGGYHHFTGFYVILAMLLFVLQLYTDFSGCIDIIMGISQMLGIELPENFDLPFISRSLSEFWRRWHITLGAFLRDYILYALLKSTCFQRLGSVCRKKFGKKAGKKIPVWCGLLISWFLIGFWHGGHWNYIMGVGLFFGCMIILGELFRPLTDRLTVFLKTDVDSFAFRLFQCIRTFCLFAFGLSFFRSYGGFSEGLEIWRSALFECNPWILFDGSLLKFGLDAKDWQVIVFYMLVLAAAGIIRAVKKEQLRILIAGQPLIFRWILYAALVMSVIVFGCYGPGYDAQAFIYQMF